MNIKKNIIVTLIIGFCVIISPIILILYKFHNHNISSEMIDWADFGNYLSGTVGITISIVNLVLLVILSLYVAKLDMHRHFNEFRYASYIKLCEKIDSLEETSKSYTDFIEFIESFISRNSFSYSKDDYSVITSTSKELISSIKPIIKILREREIKNKKELGKELKLSEEDNNYFSELLAEKISKEYETKKEEDLIVYENMKIQRNELLQFIQEKMKLNQ